MHDLSILSFNCQFLQLVQGRRLRLVFTFAMADAVATAGVKRRADEQPGAKVARPPPASTMVVLPHLKAYYKSLFPCELFYRWLSYGSASYFLKREFTLTLLGDVYIRYNCYASAAEFRAYHHVPA